MDRLYCYGSLRVGEYNYRRFKDHFNDEFQYEKTIRLKGFALYGVLGIPYPFVVRTHDNDDSIEVDVMKSSDNCSNVISQMEQGAGYIALGVDGGTVYAYATEEKLPKGYFKIPSGNWLEYQRENKISK